MEISREDSPLLAAVWRIAVLCSLLAILAFHTSGRPLGANDASRFAAIERLAHQGTFSLDGARYDTIDKVLVDGRFVANKAPVLTLLLALPYQFMDSIGLSLVSHERFVVKVLILLGSTLPFLSTWAAMRELLGRFEVTHRSRVLTEIAFGLGSLNFAYAATLNAHVPASAAAVWALVLVCRGASLGGTVTAGFLGGLAIAIDPTALFLVWILMPISWHHHRLRGVGWIVLGGAAPLVAHVISQLAATGTLLPPYHHDDMRSGPDSYWSNPVGIDATSDSLWLTMINNVVGHHGILLVCPFVGAACGLFLPATWRRLGFEARCMAIAAAVAVVVVAAFSPWYGGVCFGPRYMIFTVPILFAMAARFYRGPMSFWIGGVLAGLGIVQCLLAVRNPWSFAPAADLYQWVGLDSLDRRF